MAQNYVFNNLINVKFELRFRDLSDANLCYIVMQTCFIQCITKSRGGGGWIVQIFGLGLIRTLRAMKIKDVTEQKI